MPDTGAPWSLPYPAGSDVPDGAAQLQALAVATDAALDAVKADADAAMLPDSGWVNITTRAGFTPQTGSTPQVRKIGKVVYARWGWTNAGMSVSTTHTVADIPSGYRPPQAIYAQAGGPSAASTGMLVIGSSGTIEVRTGAALSTYYMLGFASWLVD